MRREDVLTTTEAARIAGVGVGVLNRWIDSGNLPGFHLPGSRYRRVHRQALERFLTKNNIPFDPAARYLSTGEAANLAGVASRTIASWCDRGLLKHHRLPTLTGKAGERRISREALAEFLQKQGMLDIAASVEASKPRLLVVSPDRSLVSCLCSRLNHDFLVASAVDLFEAGHMTAGDDVFDSILVDELLGRREAIVLAHYLKTVSSRLILLFCEDEYEFAEFTQAGYHSVLARATEPDTICRQLIG